LPPTWLSCTAPHRVASGCFCGVFSPSCFSVQLRACPCAAALICCDFYRDLEVFFEDLCVVSSVPPVQSRQGSVVGSTCSTYPEASARSVVPPSSAWSQGFYRYFRTSGKSGTVRVLCPRWCGVLGARSVIRPLPQSTSFQQSSFSSEGTRNPANRVKQDTSRHCVFGSCSSICRPDSRSTKFFSPTLNKFARIFFASDGFF